MAIGIHRLAELLTTHGIRHHLDADEQVIRIMFPMRRYRSLRASWQRPLAPKGYSTLAQRPGRASYAGLG